jgi:sugar (pentulose or hexulose) kinase
MSFLVIDCGTSACKAAVVSENGNMLSWSRRPVHVLHPCPFFAEVEPDELWKAVLAAARAALSRLPAARRRIEALGVSALLGYVFLDRFNRPLGPSIIWMDNRAGAEADEIRRRVPEKTLYRRTGRRVSPELLAPKLMWLAREQPGRYRRIRAVIGLKDEMVRRLSGAVQTDRAHLDYSLLFDIRGGKLDADIAAALGIDPRLFPEPHRAAEVAGRLAPEAARSIGLPAGLPVACGSSDGTTAMYGGGVLAEGAAVLVTGTTDVLMTACSGWARDRSRTITVNSGMVPGIYLAGGAMGLSGGAVRHLERLMRVRLRTLSEKIQRLPPGADGLFMLPGLTGERSPYWMEHAAGGMAGLTLRHDPEHVFRAAMEGAAFRTANLLNRMRASGLAPTRLHVVGGWADSDAWNRIRADTAGLEVLRPKETEATALGTAMFCRAAIDPGDSLRDITRQWLRFDRRYRPDPRRVEAHRALAGLFDDYLHSATDVVARMRQLKHKP